MIRNENEYREAVQRLQEERKRHLAHEKELAKSGLSKAEIKRATDPLRSFHLQLKEEVATYSCFVADRSWANAAPIGRTSGRKRVTGLQG